MKSRSIPEIDAEASGVQITHRRGRWVTLNCSRVDISASKSTAESASVCATSAPFGVCEPAPVAGAAYEIAEVESVSDTERSFSIQ